MLLAQTLGLTITFLAEPQFPSAGDCVVFVLYISSTFLAPACKILAQRGDYAQWQEKRQLAFPNS